MQFKNRSTFALDGRINGVKDMVNADVHTAASRRIDIMDGMDDTHSLGFVKSCLPPPRLTERNTLRKFITASGWSNGSACLLTFPHTLTDESVVKLAGASASVFRTYLTLTTRNEGDSFRVMKAIHPKQ